MKCRWRIVRLRYLKHEWSPWNRCVQKVLWRSKVVPSRRHHLCNAFWLTCWRSRFFISRGQIFSEDQHSDSLNLLDCGLHVCWRCIGRNAVLTSKAYSALRLISECWLLAGYDFSIREERACLREKKTGYCWNMCWYRIFDLPYLPSRDCTQGNSRESCLFTAVGNYLGYSHPVLYPIWSILGWR